MGFPERHMDRFLDLLERGLTLLDRVASRLPPQAQIHRLADTPKRSAEPEESTPVECQICKDKQRQYVERAGFLKPQVPATEAEQIAPVEPATDKDVLAAYDRRAGLAPKTAETAAAEAAAPADPVLAYLEARRRMLEAWNAIPSLDRWALTARPEG